MWMGDLYKVKVMLGNNPGSAIVKSNDKLARFGLNEAQA